MKLESSLDRRPALLHLAPVLDVMVVVVVFYLLGSAFIHHSGVAVELPVTSSQLPPLSAAHVVLITVGDPPLVLFDRVQMSYEDLIERLKDRPEGAHEAVYFKMDRRLPSGTTMKVLNAALMGGYQVYQATEPAGTSASPVTGPPPEAAGSRDGQ